ncbi:chorismate-binding protein [Sinomonas sp. ASV486]|uniref:chorismate-binding protein n=1 Tax=Sinomonas sp. ASV486 TaxID=3051170 RepID=UPI0027DB80C1|nr:chorismate-binding protein [Sinomonas sp. ASV486]MDQ4489003.1 chorismate-binding protein [Sinomonas sp. ASV486]
MAPAPTPRRPAIIAVDGRSGAGKTSLAVEVAAALREHRSVALMHLEDLYPGWDGLDEGIRRGLQVLECLRRGEPARWRPWDWAADAEGAERVTQPADVVLLEGVGASAAPLRALIDAVVWVEAADDERKRRALARDGATYAPHWDRWAAQEEAWLAHDAASSAAAVTVTLDGSRPGDARAELTAALVIDALADLPSLRDLLAPERSARESGGVVVRRMPAVPDPQALFAELFGASERAVWLDSSDAEVGSSGAEVGSRSRFSIMADDTGLLGRHMAHRRGLTEVVHGPGSATPVSARFDTPFFRWLDAEWGHGGSGVPGLECGFALGWLGYLGYELKRECGGSDVDPGLADAQLIFAARAVVLDHARDEAWLLALDAPDAEAWLDVAAAAVRHAHGVTSGAHAVTSGVHGVTSGPHGVTSRAHGVTSGTHGVTSARLGPVFSGRDSASSYMDKVRAALAEITEGNTYEVCLTTTLEATVAAGDKPAGDSLGADTHAGGHHSGQSQDVESRDLDRPSSDRPAVVPLDVYGALRLRSPAPFAAFARFGGLAIASTSPERFLAVTADGDLRAEPIKGTRRRTPGATAAEDALTDARVRAELAANPKDRAENLMIVDLLRNDLSHHAVPGSVAVSRLFAVETYATVHQLVSTIDARLRPGASRAEAIAAAFPPGSMTGAPKISTMAILDRLEAGPRGVYSGAIGYFSRTGAADLSVVIRTLVIQEHDGAARLTLGVGGAVVADSDPSDEYEEIRTKAFAVLGALGSEFPG